MKLILKALTSKMEQAARVKYLRVVIDKNLKWKTHIDELTTRLFKSVEMLYHLTLTRPQCLFLPVHIDTKNRYKIDFLTIKPEVFNLWVMAQ